MTHNLRREKLVREWERMQEEKMNKKIAARRSGNNPQPEACDRCEVHVGRYFESSGALVCGECYGQDPPDDPREIAEDVLAHLPEYLRDYSPEIADDMERRGIQHSPQAVADAAAVLERVLQDAGFEVQ